MQSKKPKLEFQVNQIPLRVVLKEMFVGFVTRGMSRRGRARLSRNKPIITPNQHHYLSRTAVPNFRCSLGFNLPAQQGFSAPLSRPTREA
jgi:hypothetical protein